MNIAITQLIAQATGAEVSYSQSPNGLLFFVATKDGRTLHFPVSSAMQTELNTEELAKRVSKQLVADFAPVVEKPKAKAGKKDAAKA
jgi:hypothetical protein